jgi:hypothetical protein
MAQNKCFPEYPEDGKCLTNDKDGVETVDDIAKVNKNKEKKTSKKKSIS